MKKLMILMLVFSALVFADLPGTNGDLPFLPVLDDAGSMAKTAAVDGFAVGTKLSGEVIRDVWVGSDFDDDGNKEVLLASYGESGAGRAYVYEITGDNTAELLFDTGDLPGGYGHSTRHVAFGDLDGNGEQELIVSVNAASAAGGLYVYEYDLVGDSMRAPVQLLSDLAAADRWYCEGFFVDDADGDGVQEIMVGNNGASSANDNFYIVSVESGTFAADNIVMKTEFTHGKSSTTFTVGGSPYGAVTADMDGDGNKEVLFSPWDNGAMLIVEASGTDTYAAVNYIETDLTVVDDFAFYDFASADLDEDGRDEAYVSMYSGGALYCITCPTGTDLSGMTTANVHTLAAAGNSGGVCTQLGDWDLDGNMEIIASGGGSNLTVHEFQGGDPTVASNWVAGTAISGSGFSGVYGMRFAGDLDGDGLPEIYAANTGAVTDAVIGIEYDYTPAAVFISELADPDNDYTGRFMELFNNTADDIDLSTWTINYYSNANTSPSVINLTGTIYADSAFVIANSATAFETMFGFAPDMESSTYQANGDDNIELVDPNGVVVDVFGIPGEDGTGTDHEFEDGRAVRLASVTTGNPVWDVNEWAIDSDAPSGIGPVDGPDGFDPCIWPTIIPLEFANVYPSSGTTIVVDYTADLTSVDVADYSLLGTSGVTFSTAEIDPTDNSIVVLTAAAEIMYDLVLDSLVDAANADTAEFYAGITPIGYTSETNPGGHIEDGYPALFHGWITANDAYNNVWIHDAVGGEHTGVMIYSSDFDALVEVGDEVMIVAERDVYNNLTELVNPMLLSATATDDPYGIFEMDGADIDTALAADTDPGEMWEGQIVKIDSAVVLSYTDYEYLCTDNDSTTYFLVGDNVDYHLSNISMTVGEMYDIVGVVDYYGGEYRINPRNENDLVKYVKPGELDITEDFSTFDDVANWRSENSGWTSRDTINGTLILSDAGWTFDGRRTVVAEPNTFFKATATIKSGSFDVSTSQYLHFGIDGLGDVDYEVSCISDTVFTTYTIIGYAVNDTGSLYIAGQGAGGADTVWVDEYTYTNNYVPELTEISTLSAARLVADGDMVATKGVVSTTTNFGSSGPAYIQDDVAGIAVYNYDVAQGVKLGDEILVVGELDIYNGLVEIKNTDYIVLSEGNAVTPIVIEAADMDGDAYEGMLVTIMMCDTLDTGLSWAATEGSNKGFSLKDSKDSTFYCYVDKDTDIDGSPKPMDWPMNITGIVGDYNGAQLLPRSLADFEVGNQAPGMFTLLNPADSLTITSLDDTNFVKILEEGATDSTLALFMNWTPSVDPDGDIVTYEIVIDPFDGELPKTQDTVICMPINQEKPWEMNDTYSMFVAAKDSLGKCATTDTITLTFDFEAPPEIVYADVVLAADGTPKLYAKFNMDIDAVTAANFQIVDCGTGMGSAPTAVETAASDAVVISGSLMEDKHVALAYTDVNAVGGTVTVADTAYAGAVLIPFSANHPEDEAKIITDFETGVGSFLDPNWSGSTTADDASSFEVTDSLAYHGAKSGKMTIVDNTASTGGWYVRELYGYPFSYEVSTSSTIMFLVRGTDAEVQMRLSVKDTGYEQSPWVSVSVTEDDWQVVSFDLENDQAEGWITGNGVVEGSKVVIEGIHMKCSADKDVELFIDGFTERPNVNGAPGAFAMVTPTEGYEVTDADVDADTMVTFAWLKAIDPDGNSVKYELFILDADADTVVMSATSSDTAIAVDAPTHEDNGNYKAYVIASDTWNAYSSSDTVNFTVNMPEVGIDEELVPIKFALHQNYPNPFNPTTTIKYDVAKDAHVKVMIFDILGRQVCTLVNQKQQAGYKTVVWNGKDNKGQMVASGVYFYHMSTDQGFTKVKRMTFMK